MEASEKLEMLLEYSNLKILPFSKKVEQGSQTFYDIRSGKIQSFSNEVATKIVAKFPEINKEWLLGDEANMLLGIYKNLSDEPIKQIETAPEGKIKKRPPNPDKQVPIYDVDFMAGNGIAMFEDAHQEAPMYYMDIPQFNGCEGFRAYNDSMEPKIKSGSILFGEKLENWHEHLEYGQIYGIVCHDNRRYLKYIKKWHENPKEYFNLVSENTFYDEFEIPKKEIKSIWLIHGWLNKNT